MAKEKAVEQSTKVIELKKHVAIIHSSNRLTLLQRKIANALLFNAYQDLMEKDEHEIHIANLCKLIGYDSNDHKTIKKALVNLLSTVLEWNLVDGEKLNSDGVWNASSIIADASIDGPVCTYSYSNKMRKLLHRPSIYGRLDMFVQSKFQSSYGLALYENCNRYQDIGQSPWFEIEKFRKLMGVEEGKYKVFRDFKSRVLDKAVEEVNRYSPITIKPQLRRVNQKVTAIQFLIQQSGKMQQPVEAIEELPDMIDSLRDQFGLSKKQIFVVLEQYSKEYINEKITLIKESPSFQQGKINNLAKYLLTALKENYQAPKASKHNLKKAKPTSKKQAAQVLDFNDSTTRKEQELIELYNRYQNNKLMEVVHALPEDEKATLIKQFEIYLAKTVRGIYNDIYHRDGITHPLMVDHLATFIRRDRREMMNQLQTYDEWVTQEQTKMVG